LKKILTLTLATLFSASVLAQPIEMLVAGKSGGSYFKLTRAIQKDIVEDTKVIDLGNCAKAKDYFSSTDKPTIMMWSQATEIVEGCSIDHNKHFAGHLFGTTWALCGPADSVKSAPADGDKIGVVDYIDHISQGLGGRSIPYANTAEIKQAVLAGDIDWGFTTLQKGMSAQAAGEMRCVAGTHTDDIPGLVKFSDVMPNYNYGTLKLDFYILSTNIDKKEIRSIVNNLVNNGVVTNKVINKGMMYKNNIGQEQELHFVKQNETLWRQ